MSGPADTLPPISAAAPVQLRPLGIGEILDAAFKLFRREFRTLVAAVLIVTIPIGIAQTLIEASTSENSFDLSEPTVIEDDFTYVAGQLIGVVLSLIAFAFATAACFRAVSAAYLGTSVGAGESLAFGARRMLPLIGTGFLMILILIPAFLALIVPGVWLYVAFSLFPPALLFEGRGGMTALKRSYRLVKGRWWPTAGTLLLMSVLVSIIQGVLSAVIIGVLLADSSNEILVATMITLITIIGYAVSLPFQAAVYTLLYFDLRVRKEGFDLQLLAERIGADGVSPESVAASIGLAEKPPSQFVKPGQQFSPPVPPGGFAPPQPPGGFAPPPAREEPPAPPQPPPPSVPPPE